jgi:hypothetical protein
VELTRTHFETRDVEGDWEAVLEEYGVTWVILPPQATLGKLLNLTPGWERIYGDEVASVWLRR